MPTPCLDLTPHRQRDLSQPELSSGSGSNRPSMPCLSLIPWPSGRFVDGHGCSLVQISPRLVFSPILTVNNTAALVHCALVGLGVCILDKWVAEPYVKTGELIRILPEYEQQVAKASIVWMASKHLSIKVRSFINHAVQSLGQTREGDT